MPYKYYNPNPLHKSTIDCTVRAISRLFDMDWDTAFLVLMAESFSQKSLPSSDKVWGDYLRNNGYKRYIIPNTCPDCYTVGRFAEDHPRGRYLLKTHEHVVAVVDGDYYDSFDTGEEVPVYYWERSANNAPV